MEHLLHEKASPPAETYSGNFGASGAQKPSLLGLCQHAAQKALAKGPIGSQTCMGGPKPLTKGLSLSMQQMFHLTHT